jgi:hypothetical protein
MSRSSFDSRRLCACLLTTTSCLPMILRGPTAARAQQSASPELLPPIEVSPPNRNASTAISRSSSAGATLAPNGSRAGSAADRGGYAKCCFTRRRQPDGYRDAIRPSCQFGHRGHGSRHPDTAIPQRARRAEHRSGVERGPNRRAGRADLGLHARHQLQSHQSAGRRHRCQRSQHA